MKFSNKTRHIPCRLFGVKCGRCGEPLGARELVMRAGPSHVYHVGCFACVACMQPLQKGQQYVVRAGGGQLFCRTDFEKEIFLMQQSVGSPQAGKSIQPLVILDYILYNLNEKAENVFV